MCRQKTSNLSPFEAHFERKDNTPLCNKFTEANQSTLTYEPISNKSLDLKTVRWDEVIPKDKWDDGSRSDVDFQKTIHSLNQDSNKRSNNDQNKERRVISHPQTGVPVPRTEAPLSFKLAKKIPKNKRSKKSLDVLYEVLAPGPLFIKRDEHTSIIKEPGNREVTIPIQIWQNLEPKLNASRI